MLRQQTTTTPYDGICGNNTCASSVQATLFDETVQFYGAEGRLRIADRRTCLRFNDNPNLCDTSRLPLGNQRSAFEEYRYDALGRRILVRSRQAYLCQINCQSTIRRTVWDGDQVLAEIQAPAATGTAAATMETDQFRPSVNASSVVIPPGLRDTADVAPTDTVPQAQTYGGFHFGRVVYTHGPGIDTPLSLVRIAYSDSIPAPQLVVLHNDWRGEYDIGSYAGGTLTKPCVRITRSSQFQTIVPGGTISDWPKAPSPQNTSWYHCVEVEWPAPHVFITRETRNRSLNGPIAWMGSLIDGMRDNSGQMYMRNRYYEPSSGRFTQEDPIGLAGGLNVYGFANGDPVNYGDPTGLTAKGDSTKGRQPEKYSVTPGERHGRCEVARILRDYSAAVRSRPFDFFRYDRQDFPSRFDFKYDDKQVGRSRDLYQVGNQWLRADEFGNFAAGYAAQNAYGALGWFGARVIGVVYATSKNSNEHWSDLDSAPMINAGADRAASDNGLPGTSINYGTENGQRQPRLTSLAGCN